MSFKLHPNLQSKIWVCELPLCTVLLEDNRHYPWLFLVPRRERIAKSMDLEPLDQLQLTQETTWAQQVLWELFEPTQLNVAAIGNKTPQLHVHVIARHCDDPAWPGTVWDHPRSDPYQPDERDSLVHKLRERLGEASHVAKR